MSTILDKDSQYAKRRQKHVSLINQLRAFGAQADLDLPRVVVIGNQSSGKSSLVEAISGITVPRDAGTCTRCPIECRISSGPQWSCRVLIRWEYATDGSTDKDVREVPFGGHISNKSDVELMLRRAQAAVLNPGRDMHEFTSMSTKELKHLGGNDLQFSRNTVCIDLSAPDLADLAFVDLPGIIQNAQEDVVTMVEDLVSSHIKGNCIILVTLPMSDDIENQKAMQLAKQADPQGLRTIGVLTKPDTVPSGATRSKELWLDVIEGRRFPLKLGYYCTRQPDEDERAARITSEDARAAELDFFNDTAPWSTAQHRYRFGTPSLIANIGMHLTRLIDDSLPKLTIETKNQLASCETHLAALPPRTADPFAFVLELVQQFSSKIRQYVQGDIEAATLVQNSRTFYRQLKSNIRNTAPTFVPFDKMPDGFNLPQELTTIEAGEDKFIAVTSKQVTIVDIRKKISGAITRELPNNVPYAVKLSLIKDFQNDWTSILHKTAEQVSNALREHISSLIANHFGKYTRLEPHITRLVEVLVQAKQDEMMKQIAKLLRYESTAYTQNDHYLSDAKELFLAQYRAVRAQNTRKPSAAAQAPAPFFQAPSFTKYSSPGTRDIVNFTPYVCKQAEFVSHNGTEYVKMVTTCTPLYHRLSWSHEELRVADYQQDLTKSRDTTAFTFMAPLAPAASVPNPFGEFPRASPSPAGLSQKERQDEEDAVLEGLKKLGFGNLDVKDLQRLKPSNDDEVELALMAEVRAYFKVAYKRIIDYVPLAIDHELLYAFADDVQSYLITRLGLNGTDAVAACSSYLAEDPEIVAERDELLTRKKRLLNVQDELNRAGI